MASLKDALRLYLKLTVAGLAGSYAYLHQRCKKLKEESMDFELINARKDTTRPSNVYYGINWGYRSDETIEKALDTGDILFFNYDCDKCFSAGETLECYRQKYMGSLTDEDPQNMGICLRTP